MKCEVCGQEYGVAHNCAGVAAAADTSSVAPAPQGFALVHYLGEAFRIVTWDDAAIRRMMTDPRAILYGIMVYIVVVSLQLAIPITTLILAGRIEHSIIIASSLAILILSAALLDFIRVGICHCLSKWFAGGSGKFSQLFGPVLLGSIVYVLVLIPFVGPLLAGLAWIAVFAMVFQEVHGIAPLTAILFSAAVGIALFLLEIYALPHHALGTTG
ncbi:MAG: hypothetical protein JSS69_14385 [Acidobacteria bacterium]|nr:hypothetical protein [Acidobacteriota bacterium]MBS1867099.1 hypothetical protein [Acidobacteriota bacterium]